VGRSGSFFIAGRSFRGVSFLCSFLEPPAESEIFDIQYRPFAPTLSAGQTLRFSLRANPTICKSGKRHDLLMEAKRQVKGRLMARISGSISSRRRRTGCASGEQNGFSLREVNVDAYRQQQVVRAKSRQMIQFSSVDYSGVLVVNEPRLFLQRLIQGYGKSRAFGCGLMLIKPGDGE
jgi:CRISPR system Cascade subunit CasE